MPGAVDLADMAQWEAHADDLTELPAACTEWVGDVRWRWEGPDGGSGWGEAVLVARSQDGAWVEVRLHPRSGGSRGRSGPAVPRYDARPGFGPVRGAVSADAVWKGLPVSAPGEPVLRALLGPGPGEGAWVEWDESRGGVVLRRHRGAGRVAVDEQVWFTDGGPAPESVRRTAARGGTTAELELAAGEGERLELHHRGGSWVQTLGWVHVGPCAGAGAP